MRAIIRNLSIRRSFATKVCRPTELSRPNELSHSILRAEVKMLDNKIDGIEKPTEKDKKIGSFACSILRSLIAADVAYNYRNLFKDKKLIVEYPQQKLFNFSMV